MSRLSKPDREVSRFKKNRNGESDQNTKRGLIHSVTTTPANDHDLNQLPELLHGDESFVSADSGYRSVEKRTETKDRKVDWFVAEMPSKIGS